ncbi:MAG: TRAM domain-containing protein, partial [Coriobacteriales bacterium]|nr:TRAM domain-containing protein [Coriobacteriales bacterium]
MLKTRNHFEGVGYVAGTVPILIESLAYHGAGVGRLPDGRVAFVEDGVVGDTVLVECVENH